MLFCDLVVILIYIVFILLYLYNLLYFYNLCLFGFLYHIFLRCFSKFFKICVFLRLFQFTFGQFFFCFLNSQLLLFILFYNFSRKCKKSLFLFAFYEKIIILDIVRINKAVFKIILRIQTGLYVVFVFLFLFTLFSFKIYRVFTVYPLPCLQCFYELLHTTQ